MVESAANFATTSSRTISCVDRLMSCDKVSASILAPTHPSSAHACRQELVQDKHSLQGMPVQNEKKKCPERLDNFRNTRMCKFNSVGLCSHGSACRFAHHVDDLRRLDKGLSKAELAPHESQRWSEWPCEEGVLQLKNTFLSVEPRPTPLRKVSSWR